MKKPVFILFVFMVFLLSCNKKQESDIILKGLDNIASKIDRDLHSVTQELVDITTHFQYKIPLDKDVVEPFSNKYAYHSNKILFSLNEESKTAIYYPINAEINRSTEKIIINSEHLDSLFIDIIEHNSILTQIYFLAKNSFLRIYPSIDVANYLNSSINLTNLLTYKTVNNKAFIDNKAFWINKPFADPYGRGWIISCAEPIYYRDRFVGIISGDIQLKNLKSKYFSSNTDIILLINKNRELICCTKEGANFLGISQFKDFQYYKPVKKDIYLYPSPALFKNTELDNAIKTLLKDKTKTNFYINTKKYTIYKSNINETNWYLLKIN